MLLGFAATEWRQARADRRTIDRALAAYAEEIEENQQRVAQGFSYHVRIDTSLQQLEAVPSGATLFGVLRDAGWQGARQVVFRDAARATAEATDVLGLLPFDSASALVGLCNTQDELDEVENGLATAAFNPAILDDANVEAALRSIGAYFNMTVEKERGLLYDYRYAIETLDLDIVAAADTLLASDGR